MKGLIEFKGKGKSWAIPSVLDEDGNRYYIDPNSPRTVKQRESKQIPASIPGYEWNNGEVVEFEIINGKALIK